MKDVDLIALAGLLHDIGKFGQRADIYKKRDSVYNNKDYKYTHAAYTAQILYEMEFNLGDEMSDNAAMHHNPQNNMQWIIAAADRMASGFEREVFEEYNAEDRENFKQQRLWHLFDEKKQFKIAPLSPENIFAEEEKTVLNEYNPLWEAFEQDLKEIKEQGNSLNDAFTIDYLLKKYTTFIPSSTSFKTKNYDAVKANIPLYEHSKTTTIFTAALYKLHELDNHNIVNYYKDKSGNIEQNDLLLIAGDFFGIQKFIFNDVPTAKASKILRAKSAYIQLLTKIVAFYIVEQLGLSYQSIISTSAGKFEILGTNDEKSKEKLNEIQKELDHFFIDRYFAETGIGLSYTECSLADFIIPGRYKKDLRKRVDEAVEASKYRKFNLAHLDKPHMQIDEGIDNQNLCQLCNKKKGSERRQNSNSYMACSDCQAFVDIGQQLAKKPYLAITKDPTTIEIFGGFYIKFIDNPKVFKNSIAVFDISKEDTFKGYAKWELSSYVATQKRLSNEEKVFLKSKLKEDEVLTDVLTFSDLAHLSVKEGIKEDRREHGVEVLMALKGDVDFMGRFIRDSDVTNSFARFNFFSRMVDYFFSVYVPHLMQEKYPDTYTVFAGGDDLFVLGAWDEVLRLSQEVQEKFKAFCEGNMSFSVGLIMTKPNKPINFVANIAEEALEESKEYKKTQSFQEKEKNAITLFNETLGWNEYLEMKKNFEAIQEAAAKYPDTFNTAFWYRLIELCDMRANIDKDIKNALWRSKVAYMFKRNIVDKHKDNDFDPVINAVEQGIENYGGAFKMAIFTQIYKRRG